MGRSTHKAMDILRDSATPVTAKYRALYELKETEGEDAEAGLVECLSTIKSVLLLHEVAFALGQRGNAASVEALLAVLQDETHNEVTRHEAGEALGAIGSPACLEVLDRLRDDPAVSVPIRETCELAAERIRLLAKDPSQFATKSDFSSVDPTPSFVDNTPPGCDKDAADRVERLRAMLSDTSVSLFDRYRCMFSLRNINTRDAVAAIADVLVKDETSALFRHELAYVLGQLENSVSTEQLLESLGREDEHPMVRHESAEALGSIATPEVMEKLKGFCTHKEPLVSESCEVALDMCNYWSQWKQTGGEES